MADTKEIDLFHRNVAGEVEFGVVPEDVLGNIVHAARTYNTILIEIDKRTHTIAKTHEDDERLVVAIAPLEHPMLETADEPQES